MLQLPAQPNRTVEAAAREYMMTSPSPSPSPSPMRLETTPSPPPCPDIRHQSDLLCRKDRQSAFVVSTDDDRGGLGEAFRRFTDNHSQYMVESPGLNPGSHATRASGRRAARDARRAAATSVANTSVPHDESHSAEYSVGLTLRSSGPFASQTRRPSAEQRKVNGNHVHGRRRCGSITHERA